MKKYIESKTLLKKAIEEMLVKGKKVDTISVSSLSDKAGISRRTFYRHFKDINELLEYSIKGEIDYLLSLFKSDNNGNIEINIKDILLYSKENKILKNQVNNSMFISFLNDTLVKYFYVYFKEGIIINNYVYKINNSKINVLTIYFIEIFLGILKKWAMRNFKDDIETISKMVSNICVEIVKNIG